MTIILKANKVNLFVSSVLFVFLYHSANILDTLHICNISWLRVNMKQKYIEQFFMVDWPCILNYINNNQHDALFICSLFSYHTFTCFGRISSPSSGGRMYTFDKWYLLYFWVDCQRTTWPVNNQLRSTRIMVHCVGCYSYTELSHATLHWNMSRFRKCQTFKMFWEV
jgi:hypothetical protein